MTYKGTGMHTKGFASMNKDRVREIASSGGKAAQAQGKAHKYTSEEARAAGLKSVEARKAKKLAQLSAQGGK